MIQVSESCMLKQKMFSVAEAVWRILESVGENSGNDANNSAVKVEIDDNAVNEAETDNIDYNSDRW